MVRRFSGSRLVVASHNDGKVREIGELLAPLDVEALSAKSLGLPEPEETGASFGENAILKARAAAVRANVPALADDSGLSVDALGGAPGLYSARWAGEARNFASAMARVEAALRKAGAGGPLDRRARFFCALALAWPDGHAESFLGEVAGTLVWPPRGTRGFGYDPIFLADGYAQTFGEMEPARKHRVSHRAKAFEQLIAHCFA